MIKKGSPLSLDDVIAKYQNDDVFNGKYYENMLSKADPSTRAKYESVRKDIVDNSLINGLKYINGLLSQMGLSAQMFPQTNSKGTITGYQMTVYQVKDKNKVLDKSGHITKDGRDLSWTQSIDVAFADTVNLGHSRINDYVELLDREKNESLRLKRQEASIKIFGEKLKLMLPKAKDKTADKVGLVKTAYGFARDEINAANLKTPLNVDDKDKNSYKTGSQAINAMLANRVNLAPVLSAMKYAYGVNERYNNKIMETLSLVTKAESEEKALNILAAREKDLRSGVKNYEGLKKYILSARHKKYDYDVGNTPETAYAVHKMATSDRNFVAGDVLLSSVVREQGRKNNSRIEGSKKSREKQAEMFARGVLASRAGEAAEVEYAGNVMNDEGDLAYDAVVKAIEITDEELAKRNQKALSVREGQSIVSKNFAKIMDYSHHTMSQTYNEESFKKEKERLGRVAKLLTARIKSGNLTSNEKEGLEKDLAQVNSLFGKDGNFLDKTAVARNMYLRFLKREGMELLKDPKVKGGNSGLNIFQDADSGVITVSGEGRVRFNNGRRGVDTVNNLRSAMVKGIYRDEKGRQRNAFEEISLSDVSGNDRGSLASHNIQVMVGREQLDARKYGQRMKSDLVATLTDAREGGRLNDFFSTLAKDATDKALPEATREYAQFFSEILKKGSGGKVYISDDSERVKSLLRRNSNDDDKARKYLSGLLDYLDTVRNMLGGNEGLGKVYALDGNGNLVRTSASRTFYTNLGGDDNIQWGRMSDKGAVNFRTGHDSMTRALNIAVSDIVKNDKQKNVGELLDLAKTIVDQFDAPQKNKEELEELQKSNDESMRLMKDTLDKGIDVKSLSYKNKEKGGNDRKYITVGKGDGYDIDISNIETEAYKDGAISNESRTLTYAIDQARKTYENGKDLQVVIDTQGVTFGKTKTYGDKSYGYGGRAIFLDKYNGRGDRGYGDRDYKSVLNNTVVGALQHGNVKYIEDAADLVVERMHDSVYFKEGGDFDRLMNGKMSHSMSGKTTAVNMANILAQEEYEKEKQLQAERKGGNADYTRLLKSDIASYGVEVSAETVKKVLDGWNAGKDEKLYSTKELLEMLRGFGIKRDQKEDQYAFRDEKGKVKRNNKGEMILDRDRIIKAIIDTLTVDSSRWKQAYRSGKLTEGLQATAGRFPFMSGLDLDPTSKVFIGRNLEGDQVMIGAGLAKKENADYDGDHESLRFLKFTAEQRGLFSKSSELRADILQKLAWIAKEEGRGESKNSQVFSDDFYKGVSSALVEQSAALASRRNKGATGVFSNFATQIRNMMRDRGFDETAMKHGLEEEMENGAGAILVRSFFEAMEQDVISAKKVIKRLAKELGVKQSQITEEMALQKQKETLEQVDTLMEDFYNGKINFLDLNKLLRKMGILGGDEENSELQNRVTQEGLLTIEKMNGGKDYLQKLYGGHYLEYATYGIASKKDVEFAKSFEKNGGFKAWDQTKEAADYYKRLKAAGAKYNKKDIYEMLLGGKTSLADFGTIGQKVFEGAMTQASEFMREHGEYGVDGTADSLLRAAHFKTHSPDKKSVEANPYHAGPMTAQEVEAIEKETGQSAEEKKKSQLILGSASAISTLAQDLAGASGDVSKSMSVVLNALMGFVDQANVVASGMLTPYKAAEIMKANPKWFREPYSTTSITRMFSPYEGVSSDPLAVKKVLENSGKQFLGFGSLGAMKDALGNGQGVSAALLGHAVGERTQFTQSLRNVASERGWQGDEEALINIFKNNISSLEKELDSASSQELVKFYREYSKSEADYLNFLRALHGANGYNDKDFFLSKQGYKKYEDILERLYEGQSKVMETFFSPGNLVKVNGKTSTTNETAFIGMADASGETNYIGRTDISGLIKEKYTNRDGTVGIRNVLALVDQKTKTGKTLTAADILQGLMNANAARQDIEWAKLYAAEGGGGYDEWIKTAAAQKLKERTEREGYDFDGRQRYEELIAANNARSYIEKTNSKTGETHLIALDSVFDTPMLKNIMGEVAQVMKGNIPQDYVIKMINSMASNLVDAGVNFRAEPDSGHPYASIDSPDVVSKAYLGFAKKKINLESEKKKLEYQLKIDNVDLSEAEKKLLKEKADKVKKDLKNVNEAIGKALETGASAESFVEEVDGKSVTTNIKKELSKARKTAKLELEKYKNDSQNRAADLYTKLMEKKADQEGILRQAEIQLQYKYGVDTPEKRANVERTRNEVLRNLAITNNDIAKGNFQERVGGDEYARINLLYQDAIQENNKNLNNGILLSAREEAGRRYNKLLKERISLQEKEKEILYEINHLSKNSTEEEKEAYDTQLQQNKEAQKNVAERIASEDKIKGIDRSSSRDFEAAEEAASKKSYQDYVAKRQKEASARLSAQLKNLVDIRKRQSERNIRSNASGSSGISKEQRLLNQQLNEQDEAEYQKELKFLASRDWENDVGGAEAYAAVLQEAALNAKSADRSLAALNADLNPTIWEQLTKSVKGWFNQMLRGQLVWKVLGMVQNALKTVIEDAKKLDSVLVDLQIVTGGTREDAKRLISTYSSLAQQLSVTTSEVASAANDWLRQGYSVSETTDLITASMQLSKLGMIESGQATSYLTSMLKGFKLEASDATSVVDKLTKVDMSAATSAGDIAESLRQFATTAQLSGLDLNESIAMATTIMDVSQKDASSTGNAVKTMLSRYGNVKAGTYSGMNITGDQNETTESLNDIEKVLRKLGISLRSSNLEFREFDDVLDDIAAKWDTIDSVSKNAIATAMAGTRQRESFLVLMENYDKYKDFIDEAANAEGTAAEKYKAYEDSLEASQKKLAAAWEELASKTEVVDFFKQINNVATSLVKILPTIARVFLRMFGGKAAVNAISILGRSLPSAAALKSIATSPLSSVREAIGNPLLREGRLSVTANGAERSGLIDSQIRRGTSPILAELKKIASNTAKQPGLSSGVSGKGIITKDFSQMSDDEILRSKDIDYNEKKRLLNDRFKGNWKERLKFNKSFEESEYIATHSEEITLEDGTKLSNVHANKNGTYSAKGRRAFVSKEEYEKAKSQQEANNKAAAEEFKLKKQSLMNQAMGEAAVAGILGYLSADTTNSHRNQFTGELVDRETTDKYAQGMMKSATGLTTLFGYLVGGKAGGTIGGLIGDALNKYVLAFLPSVRRENEKQDRFEQTDKKKSQVESIKTVVSSVIEAASKDLLTADDYSNLIKSQNSLRDELTKSENSSLKEEFVNYANKFLAGQSEGNEYASKSFEELTNLADMTDAQRKKTAYALKVAQTKQGNLAENAEYEKEIADLKDDLGDDYLDVSGKSNYYKNLVGVSIGGGAAMGATAGGLSFGPFGALFGAVVGAAAGGLLANEKAQREKAAALDTWNNHTREEQIAILENMQKAGIADSSKLQEMISKLQNINDTINKIRDKMDQQRVEEGILEMAVGKNPDGTNKTLLDMSSNAIKDMGADEIIERMAEYLQEKHGGMANGSSYFYTDENGNRQVAAAARASILRGLKSNTEIYGSITGQNSKLSEVFGMKDGQTKTEMLENFANALHVSVEELYSLGDVFGQFTLGDVSASADDLAEKFSNLETTITNIAAGSQSWAATLQNVAKNYPELLGYASDEYSLSLAMFQKMKDYQKLQTDAQMSDIMSNESYFDTFSDKLKETLSDKEWEEFRQVQVNSFSDLQQYVANSNSDLSKKLNEAAQQELSNIKLAASVERQALEKVVSIKSSQIDKEINNLSAQKEAMQNINSQREYENKLIEAKLKLEHASKEKKRVWREGVGWVYEEDQASISEAQKNLDSVKNEKSVSALTQQINQLNIDKENLSAILSDQEEAIQAAFLQAYEDANGVTKDSVASLGSDITAALQGQEKSANDKWDEWMKEYKEKESNAKNTLAGQFKVLQDAKEAMNKEGLTPEQKARAQENYNAALAAYQKTYNEGLSSGYWKADDFAQGGGMSDVFKQNGADVTDATAAGAGGKGYTKAEPDQYIYQKTESGSWNRFIFNPGKTRLLSSVEWNNFYDKNGGADLYNSTFGDGGSDHKLSVTKDSNDRDGASIFQAAKDNPSSTGFASWLNDYYPGATLGRMVKGGTWVRFLGGLAYKLDTPETIPANQVPEEIKNKGGQFRKGSLDVSKGNRVPLLMNEEGTEAIVTPQGTITALPSHSGILPENITASLWNLGNYAPDLLMALQRQSLMGMNSFGTATDNSVDNSVNINTVEMTVDADNSFNVDSFVQQLQQVAALTRNDKH